LTLIQSKNVQPPPAVTRSHSVKNLQWTETASCPWKRRRLTKIQQMGLTYERKVVKFFRKQQWPGALLHGQWFKFRDCCGSGFCCPDILLVQPTRAVIFECKLTQTPSAHGQLSELYGPVVGMYYGLPVVLCEVFRNLLNRPERLVRGLDEMLPDLLNSWHLYL